jgi:putative membrane protein (TIGR04086 family)
MAEVFFMFNSKIFGFNLLKAILISLIFSCVSILIFALVLYLFSIPNEAIKPVNCLIKVMATFIGCFFSIKGEKGFIKGLVYGGIITIVAILFFALLSGGFTFGFSFLWELLLGLTVGAVAGIVAVNKKNN